MLASELKRLAEFIEDLEKVCTKHNITLGFQGHEQIIHPRPLGEDVKGIRVHYSEMLGVTFDTFSGCDEQR